MKVFLLGYLFLSFAIGFACLGIALVLVVRRRDLVSRSFLAFYLSLSLMVSASLGLAFADSAPGVLSGSTLGVLQYLQTIVGLYGMLLALPLLVHAVFGVEKPSRERLLIGAVLATFGLQHVTEFALGSTVWDQRGDWFEDGVLLLVMGYTVYVACTGVRSVATGSPLARRLFTVVVLSAPGTLYDLFLGEGLGVPLYPLWYCVASVVVTWTLIQDDLEPRHAAGSAPVGWALSARELEVAGQVALGLSNKEIATALHISPNTVKTHLRKVFEKAGVQSRFELITRMSGPARHHPGG